MERDSLVPSRTPTVPGIVPSDVSEPKLRSTSEKGSRGALPPRGAPAPSRACDWSGLANDELNVVSHARE